MLELRHLRYFLAVAKNRNFTRAAEELHIAQPPLSRQIRDLEFGLGVKLFDRKSRPLQLTEAGRVFYNHAHNIMGQMALLQNSMHEIKQSRHKSFTVGFVPSVLYSAIPEVIRLFGVANPDVDLQLIEMTSLEQITALCEGRIDAGFGRVRYDNALVKREVVVEEPLMVALPVELANMLPQIVSLLQLAQYNLIIYPSNPRPSYADQVLSLFRDYNLVVRSIQEVRELQTAIGLVSANIGITIVPQSVQALERHDVVYRPLLQDAFSPIIISLRQNDKNPLLREFHSLVFQKFQNAI